MSAVVRTPRPLDLGALSVLVIDDQPFFRVLLTEVLRSLGISNIAVAVDGEDGFTAFTDMRPDVVITDWMMPKLDGIELTRRIRTLSQDALQKVPVILVTARSERGQVDFARSAGIDEFILKPISAKSICDRIREVIEKPRPFITLETYTGPCRRRRTEPSFFGPYRRFDDTNKTQLDDADILQQGLLSVFVAAMARIAKLGDSLKQSNANIGQIQIAVCELQAIAEDMSDTHLTRVSQLLLVFVALMNKSGQGSPEVIQTHMNAMAILLRTPISDSKARDEIVLGLERIMKQPTAA